ncbi:MAG: hypothetical protein HYR85_17605 [Planctomycetes bacterium]|nr:hypothetical protein [Planctomycetota bacterium]MBI3845270.1 hypothetical protein [Planctomycetota bacterium]
MAVKKAVRDRHRQKRRNPARCHRMTVSGFTMMSADLHADHERDRAIQYDSMPP